MEGMGGGGRKGRIRKEGIWKNLPDPLFFQGIPGNLPPKKCQKKEINSTKRRILENETEFGSTDTFC